MEVAVPNQSEIVRTLIADDQPDVLQALTLLLKDRGYEIHAVNSPAGLLESLHSGSFDVVLMDLNYTRDTTSGDEGMDLLTQIRLFDENLPVVAMTAWGSVELAVEAIHRGVGDFVLKPWNNQHLLTVLEKQVQLGREKRKKLLREEEQENAFLEAREIQRGLIPQEIPQIPGFEISCVWQPAQAVGGDSFDIFKFNETQLAFCIADVVGKGMPAALLMSNLQAAVRSFASEEVSPKETCNHLNRILGPNLGSGKFITFFYGHLDAGTRRLRYANAGHNAPIVIRAELSPFRLSEGGAALGAFQDWSYGQGIIQLQSGDRIVLFTDGITEACKPNGEEYGESRLLTVLAQAGTLSAEALQKKIFSSVIEFTDGAFQDDATLIVIAVH
ncbi:MAG: SpoIIE family protein phosphatase [Acidobacteriia bacterium]|nr:SpoIIE family protein phosphatase [Terriglobia bacterium]